MEFTYSIRQATPDDAEVILELIRELAMFEKMSHQCKLTLQQVREDGFGEQPLFQSLIAEVKLKNGEIKTAGQAIFYYEYSTFSGKNVHLEDLYVREPYRKHGIGADLMKTVAKVATENGCERYNFVCLGWNTAALDFYKSYGVLDVTDTQDWHLMRLEKAELHQFAAKLGQRLDGKTSLLTDMSLNEIDRV